MHRSVYGHVRGLVLDLFTDVSFHAYRHKSIDMCTDMSCLDMFLGMGTDMGTDVCICRCADMCPVCTVVCFDVQMCM